MGGCRCSYKNCNNTTKTTENIHFFHYPVKHKERCKIWIDNACKPQFYELEEDQLKNKVICEVHFEDMYFPNIQKKRLLQSAIPTLDGPSDPVYTPSTKKEVLPLKTNIQDVQIMPTNEDRTTFVLDTNSMYKLPIAQKVESYIYKNGAIVPSKPSTTTKYYDLNSKFNIHSKKFDDLKVTTEIEMSKPEPFKSSQDYIEEVEDKNNERHHPKKIVKAGTSNKVIEKTVGRSYLRQIKQHSREIAVIKRMLKEKGLEKPDNSQILSKLKELIPSTLYKVLEIHLNNKCTFSEEDKTFFREFKAAGPKAYQQLCEKYEWNLPGDDILNNST